MLGATVRYSAIVFFCSLCIACMDDSKQAEPVAELPAEISFTMLKGSRQPLDIAASLPQIQSPYEIVVLEEPLEGVLFRQPAHSATSVQPHEHDAPLSYQHGGTSMKADRFVFRLKTGSEDISEPIIANIVFREGHAQVVINSPRQNEKILTDEVVVAYEASGNDFDHLHISIDNLGHNTIRELNGRYILKGLTNGEHTVVAQLVDQNHRPVKYANSHDSVSIFVDKSDGEKPN